MTHLEAWRARAALILITCAVVPTSGLRQESQLGWEAGQRARQSDAASQALATVTFYVVVDASASSQEAGYNAATGFANLVADRIFHDDCSSSVQEGKMAPSKNFWFGYFRDGLNEVAPLRASTTVTWPQWSAVADSSFKPAAVFYDSIGSVITEEPASERHALVLITGAGAQSGVYCNRLHEQAAVCDYRPACYYPGSSRHCADSDCSCECNCAMHWAEEWRGLGRDLFVIGLSDFERLRHLPKGRAEAMMERHFRVMMKEIAGGPGNFMLLNMANLTSLVDNAASMVGSRVCAAERRSLMAATAAHADVDTAPTAAPAADTDLYPGPTAAPVQDASAIDAPTQVANIGSNDDPFAIGDPHLVNLNNDRFDINQAGKHVMLRVPQRTEVLADLEMTATITPSGISDCGMFIQKVDLTGKWLQSQEEIRVQSMSNANILGWPFSVSVGPNGPWVPVENFSNDGLVIAKKPVGLSGDLTMKATSPVVLTIRLGDPTTESLKALDKIVPARQEKWQASAMIQLIQKRTIEPFLDIKLLHFGNLARSDVGGLLGADPHDPALEAVSEECREEMGRREKKREISREHRSRALKHTHVDVHGGVTGSSALTGSDGEDESSATLSWSQLSAMDESSATASW